MDLNSILDTATTIARDAGALLLDGFGREKQIETKSSAVDFVTQFDRAAETLITDRLRAAFPGHGLLGEEGTDETGAQPYTWIIDPLDGTSNYAHGFPVFCVSLALYQGQQPLVGVVYDPTRDECFRAAAGQGATISGPNGTRPLRVSAAAELVGSLLATGFPYDVHTSPLDNAAYVAAGRLDGYWEFKVHAWDVAAGILLVQEAGGCVTLIDGRPLGFARQMHIVASNGVIHEAMLEVIREVGS